MIPSFGLFGLLSHYRLHVLRTRFILLFRLSVYRTVLVTCLVCVLWLRHITPRLPRSNASSLSVSSSEVLLPDPIATLSPYFAPKPNLSSV